MFKRDERGAQVMRERNGGSCDRPRPFSGIAIWAGIVLAKCRGSTPLQALKSAAALVLCLCAGGSEQLAHDEWGGVFFPV